MTEIGDFFTSYPRIDYEIPTDMSEFNSILASKAEFRELKAGGKEIIAPRGEMYKHQKLVVRYLTWYDRLLLMHEPGTGKSCIVTHSAELFKREYLKNPKDITKIRKAYILVRGPTLTENIKHEIVCKCTDRIYETELVLRANSEKAMKANLKRALDTWYDIMTYRTFESIIRSFDREQDLVEFMSCIAVYIDEAHRIPTLEYIRASKTLDINEPIKKTEDSLYENMWKALHKGRNNVVVCITATPMINTPNDIIPIINLVTPLDLQMPGLSLASEQDQEAFANLPFEYFEPYFRGRVSYARALDTGAVKVYPGSVPITGTSVRIYRCYMSAFQYSNYLRYESIASGAEDESFYLKQRQASNFVFPDGSAGAEGFDKYVEKQNGVYKFKDDEDSRICRKRVGSMAGLSMLGGKFADIVDICTSSFLYPNVEIDDTRGIVYIYFADFVHGSGAVLLGLCLKEHGYEEFRASQSIFIDAQDKGIARNTGPCASVSSSTVERQPRQGFEKRKRFAILSGSTASAQITTMFNTLNSYENRYGEYLQVIIGSKASQEGININNGTASILATSNWNRTNNIQAEMRVFRTSSHDYRLAEKRKRTGDPNATFNVRVYNMASVYEPDAGELEEFAKAYPVLFNAYEPYLLETNNSLIDAKMYAKTEAKDKLIRKIMHNLKRASIDCRLNEARNKREYDKDFSPDCDYTVCDYICAGKDIDLPIDYSGKYMYYSSEDVEKASKEIIPIMSTLGSVKLDTLYALLPNTNKIYIDMAIHMLSKTRVKILDRTGQVSYLQENSDGVVYLERGVFGEESKPEDTAYTSVLIGTQDPHTDAFANFVTTIQREAEVSVVQRLKETPPEDAMFAQLLDTLSLASRVDLLEQAIMDKHDGNAKAYQEEIMNVFSRSVYSRAEPLDLLEKTRVMINGKNKGRGRKPNPSTQAKVKRPEFNVDIPFPAFDATMEGQRIYLHTLWNLESHTKTNYNAVKRWFKADGDIRIYKPSENIGWRSVNEYEYLVYNTLIREQNKKIREYYENFPIYGIMLPPNREFQIRDKEAEDQESLSDARKGRPGRVCTTWKKSYLYDVMYRLGIPAPETEYTATRDNMISLLKYKRIDITPEEPDEKIRYLYNWAVSNQNIKYICDTVKNHLISTGKMLTDKPIPGSFGKSTRESIQTGPFPTELAWSQPFSVNVASETPAIPGRVLPIAANMAHQDSAHDSIPVYDTSQMYEIPVQPGPIPNLPPGVDGYRPMSSNVGPILANTRILEE